MSEKIEPALTPEEWATGRPETALDGYVSWENGIVDVAEIHMTNPKRFRHALAAAALYGQPFGFTQEDLALIRSRFDLSDDQYRTDDEVKAASLYARIAALLPPETA